MSRRKLCNPVHDDDRKDAPILVRLTRSDADKIRYAASIRQMTTSEFIRRAALGRKADVDYDTEIVLALIAARRAITEIRLLHTAMVEQGFTPPADDWKPVMLAIRAAIERVAN